MHWCNIHPTTNIFTATNLFTFPAAHVNKVWTHFEAIVMKWSTLQQKEPIIKCAADLLSGSPAGKYDTLTKTPLREREREIVAFKAFYSFRKSLYCIEVEQMVPREGIWASAELISPPGPTDRQACCSILNQHNSCWWIKHQLRLILKLLASWSLTTWTLPT